MFTTPGYTMWCTILLVLTVNLTNTLPTGFNELYFERDFAILHTRIDLSDTMTHFDKLDHLLWEVRNYKFGNNLLVRAELEKSDSNWMKLKGTLVTKLEKKLEHCKSDLTRTTNRNRSTRAIEFLGDIFSYITGVPNAEQYRKHEQTMHGIMEIVGSLDKIEKNSEIAIRLNANSVTKLNDDLNLLSNNLELDRQLAQRGLDDIFHLWSITVKLESMLDNLCQTVSDIQMIILNGKLHYATPKGFNDNQLRKDVYKLEQNYNGLTPIFGSVNHWIYYDVPLTSVTVSKKSVWTSIRIPLVKRGETYKISNNIELETIIELIETKFRVKLLQLELDGSYIVISKDIYTDCLTLINKKLCGIQPPIIMQLHGELTKFNSVWALYEKNKLVVWNSEPTKASYNCGKLSKSVIIPIMGKLMVEQGCSLMANMAKFTNTENGTEMDSILNLKIEDESEFIHWHLRYNRTQNIEKKVTNNTELLMLNTQKVENLLEQNDNERTEMYLRMEFLFNTKNIAIGGSVTGLLLILFTVCIAYLFCKYRKIVHYRMTTNHECVKSDSKPEPITKRKIATIDSCVGESLNMTDVSVEAKLSTFGHV